MTDVEKIEYAKGFIDKLANGINPINDEPIPENDIANNVRLSRCFFYVSDILRQVIENGGIKATRTPKPKKQEFSLTPEQRLSLQASNVPLTVSEISKHLNSFINEETTKLLGVTAITNWLSDAGFLATVTLANGKHRKNPTLRGKEIGIFTEERTGKYGTYISILYNAKAQQFIFDNLEAIVAFKNEK